MTRQRHFLVLSSGYCGSLWLGAALDRLPEISCSSSRLYGLTIPHNSGINLAAVDPCLINAIATASAGATPSAMFTQCAQRKAGATVLGDVHGWRVETLPETLPEQPVLAHLVRHPVVQLERIVQEQAHRYREFPRIRAFMTDNFSALCQKYGAALNGLEYSLDHPERALSFVWGFHEIYRVMLEVAARPDIPVWGFEPLINDRAHFRAFVCLLTGGTVEVDSAVLDSLFTHSEQQQLGRFRNSGLNSHTDPAGVWAGWIPQEQALFRRLAETLNPAALYAPVGYSFDFLASDGAA